MGLATDTVSDPPRLLFALLDLYTWVIIIRALISWASPRLVQPDRPTARSADRAGAAPVASARSPSKLGGLDLSPMLVILVIQLLKYGLVYSLALRPAIF